LVRSFFPLFVTIFLPAKKADKKDFHCYPDAKLRIFYIRSNSLLRRLKGSFCHEDTKTQSFISFTQKRIGAKRIGVEFLYYFELTCKVSKTL